MSSVQTRLLSAAKREKRETTMQTVVVNINKEQFDIYIGRAGRGEDGYFGNPFRIGERNQPGGCCPEIPKILHRRELKRTLNSSGGYWR